jgi:glycerol-3-phosphate cytidylyltransferase-like family protein
MLKASHFIDSYRKPVLNYDIRKRTIEMSKLADEVIEAPLRSTLPFIEDNRIDFVTHGSDWTEDQVEDYYGDMRRAGKLKIVPHTPGICTSDIISTIKSRADL